MAERTSGDGWRGSMTEWRGQVMATLEALDRRVRDHAEVDERAHNDLKDELGKTSKELSDELKELRNAFNKYTNKTDTDVAVLKLKAGVWGLVGGLIPAVGVIVVFIALELLKNAGP
jgi:hypothetical protein